MTKRASSRAEPSLNLAPPPGIKLILASEDLLAEWGTRTERGERITAEWGEPDEHGWYTPMFTVHADDRMGALDAAWAAVEAALPEGWTVYGLQDPLARDLWQATAASAMPEKVGSCECCGQERHAAKREYLFASGPTPAAALLGLASAQHEHAKR